jgi:hypothetical protein
MKKKHYADGGLAEIAQSAQDMMTDVDSMATKINYGTSGTSAGANQALGFNAINNMKRGGKVSSASKRADGCAIRGKTRA